MVNAMSQSRQTGRLEFRHQDCRSHSCFVLSPVKRTFCYVSLRPTRPPQSGVSHHPGSGRYDIEEVYNGMASSWSPARRRRHSIELGFRSAWRICRALHASCASALAALERESPRLRRNPYLVVSPGQLHSDSRRTVGGESLRAKTTGDDMRFGRHGCRLVRSAPPSESI